jgi:hypothetical protein
MRARQVMRWPNAGNGISYADVATRNGLPWPSGCAARVAAPLPVHGSSSFPRGLQSAGVSQRHKRFNPRSNRQAVDRGRQDRGDEGRGQCGDVAARAAVPAWITPELIEETIRVWQPYYATRLAPEDAVIMIRDMGRLFGVLATG